MLPPFLARSAALFAALVLLRPASWAEERPEGPVREAWADSWQYAADSSDSAIDVALDREGNVAVLSTTFREGFFTPVFLSRYDGKHGDLSWRRPINVAFAIGWKNLLAMDGQGNVVVGGVGSSTDIEPEEVVKFAANGEVVWRKAMRGEIEDLAADREGNIIVASSRPDFRGNSFTAKFASADGHLEWQDFHRGGGGARLAVGRSGDVAVAFGDGPVGVRKLSGKTGRILWQHLRNDCVAAAVGMDAEGNVLTATAHGVRSQGYPTWVENRATKYAAANGAKIWEKKIRPFARTGSLDAAVDASGDLALLAVTSTAYYVAKYRASDGRALWTRQRNNEDFYLSYAINLAVDRCGDVVLARSKRTGPLLTEKLSGSSGQPVWKREFGRFATPSTVAVGDGVVVVVGSTRKALTVKYCDGATPVTQPAYGISANYAGLRAVVNPNGLVARAAFEYSTEATLAQSLRTEPVEIGGGETPVRIEASLVQLSPGTTYYFRAIGFVGDRITHGETLSFQTH